MASVQILPISTFLGQFYTKGGGWDEVTHNVP